MAPSPLQKQRCATTLFVYDGADLVRDLDGSGAGIVDLNGPGVARLTKIKYPEATAGAGRLEENFTYDSAGNLLQKTDQDTRITSFCYDSSNRLTSTTDPALKTTSYEYNARSQQTAVVDAINQRYEFVYDALGRRTQEKKGTATMSFLYDAAGNRSQRTDYNGVVTNYTSDALNRLTNISYPDTTSATYGYDELSRLTTATNATGTVTIAYDNRSRVSSVTDVFGQVVSYAYDPSSNRTQLSLNGTTSATYQYDVINRLTQLSDNASLNTTFAYDPTNKLTSRTLPNGVVTTSQYDGLNRLTRLTHAKMGNTLADFQYQFNVVSNITQMIDGAGTHNYTYDSSDRLTAATHPNQTNESYTFDDVGNRTASHQGSSYTYQAFNRLVAANGASFGYDAKGNLTSKSEASGSWTYSWDYENRLKQASFSGGVAVNYSYDALGRRIQRLSTASGTTKFVYDGADVLRDLDGNGNTVADYLNGLGIDNKLRQTTSGAVSYFAADHLGTTRALTDVSGNLTSALGYGSFGRIASGAATTRYTYTGREIDLDTGLYYYRARWYDPHEGRFASDDPIGLSGGLNPFAYVKNQPLRFRDPEGLRPLISADDFGDPYRGERSRFNPNYEGPVDRFVGRFVDPYLDIVFGGGGLFRRDVFVEFISANERSRQPCKTFGERFVQSFTETNAAIPGLAAASGAGLAPARNAAEFVGEPTLYRWADNWFAPPNGISNGPFIKGTMVRTGLVSLSVSGAWEAGVGVGSLIDAAGCPCGY